MYARKVAVPLYSLVCGFSTTFNIIVIVQETRLEILLLDKKIA